MKRYIHDNELLSRINTDRWQSHEYLFNDDYDPIVVTITIIVVIGRQRCEFHLFGY